MLNDWSGIDQDLAVSFILRSIGYDGGIAQQPGLESHGGSTFCGVASLSLMGRLGTLDEGVRAKLVHWLVSRQVSGFQGRPHKPVDTCYSFWIAGCLALLNASRLTDHDANRAFLMTTQNPLGGGFSKWPDTLPDPLHAYMAVAGLSLQGEPGVAPLHPALNITRRAAGSLALRNKSSWTCGQVAAAAGTVATAVLLAKWLFNRD